MSGYTIPEHITVDTAKHSADCAVCSTGVTIPGPHFGPIAAVDLLASFVVLHAVHHKGKPRGLTVAGRPTREAAALIFGGTP